MVEIISRATVGLRAPTNRSYVDSGRRTAFVVHFDGGTPITADAFTHWRRTQAYHMDSRGWSDIGYNFGVHQNGQVVEGRGWDVLGAHAGAAGNVVGIGVQAMIGGAQQPSAALLSSLVGLYDDACARFGRALVWRGHRDYMSTDCPGEPLYAWVQSDHGVFAPGHPPIDAGVWDGTSFPGPGAFVLGQRHPAVTLLGDRLVKHGWTGYQVGPGPVFTEVDKAGTQWFQQAQGWTGADADGYPGPETWRRLMAQPGSPVPTPAPAPSVPVVRLSHLLAAMNVDTQPSTPTGTITYGDPVGALAVEQALAQVVPYSGPIDGSFGTNFVKAYSAWQRMLGYSGHDADGWPGLSSLAELGRRTGLFEVTP